MQLEPTTLAGMTGTLTSALGKRGLTLDAMLREAGLDPGLLKTPGSRYPLSGMNRLWDVVIGKTGNEALGIEIGEHLNPAALHAVGLSFIASHTLGDAFERMVRYTQVVTSGTSFSVRKGNQIAEFRLAFPSPVVKPTRWAVDAALANIVTLSRYIAGDDFAPMRVNLVRDEPADPKPWHDHFRCPVAFLADGNSLEFDQALLEKPSVSANEELANRLDQASEQYLASIDQQKTATRVYAMLADLLPAGEVRQQYVASQLNQSLSTLQRRLRDEGTTFRKMLDEVRRRKADEYLGDPDNSLAQIAYLLGFSDQANFTRAYKRWTGTTPGERKH